MMQRPTIGRLSPREQILYEEIKNLIYSYGTMAQLANSEKKRSTRFYLLMDVYDTLKTLLQYDAYYDTDQKAKFERHLKMVKDGLQCDEECAFLDCFNELSDVAFTTLTFREALKENKNDDDAALLGQMEKVPKRKDMPSFFASVAEKDAALRSSTMNILQPAQVREVLPPFTWKLRLPDRDSRTIYTVLVRAKDSGRLPDSLLKKFFPTEARPGWVAFHFLDMDKAMAAYALADPVDEPEGLDVD
jgi:hypothetical protein